MGNLLNPLSLRLNTNKFWKFNWVSYTKKNYTYLLINDFIFYKFFYFFIFFFKLLEKQNIAFLINFKIFKNSFNNLNIFLLYIPNKKSEKNFLKKIDILLFLYKIYFFKISYLKEINNIFYNSFNTSENNLMNIDFNFKFFFSYFFKKIKIRQNKFINFEIFLEDYWNFKEKKFFSKNIRNKTIIKFHKKNIINLIPFKNKILLKKIKKKN